MLGTFGLDGSGAAIHNSNGTGSDGLAGFSDNLAAGRFELRNGAAFSATSAFANAGHVVVGAGSGFATAAGATYTQTAGSTTVAGTLTTSSVELYGGLLSITGTVAGSVNNYGGTVDSPGVPGKLTILGDFTQHAGGKLLLQIGGTERGMTYDWLSVGGTATLGGELEIVFLNGYIPAPGTSFDLMSYSNVLGSFDTTRITGIGGTSESFAFGPNGMSLTINPVPEPETYAMLLAGLGLLGFVARRKKQRAA